MKTQTEKDLNDLAKAGLTNAKPYVLNGTETYTCPTDKYLYYVYIVETAVFASGTDWNLRGYDVVTNGTSFPAGAGFYMEANTVTLASGTVIVYEKSK